MILAPSRAARAPTASTTDRRARRPRRRRASPYRARVVRRIERGGDRRALREHLAAPVDERRLAAPAFEPQSRLAAARGDALLVASERGDLLRRVRRAVAQQAMQQVHVEQVHRCGHDADGQERVEVHEPHLDVLDAALAQRVQRPLALADAALRPDRAVELVLDLQQRHAELAVIVAVADADRLVGRIRAGERALQRRAVALEAVVADGERRLRVALVAEPAHAQRRRVREVEACSRDSRCELVLATLDEARAHGRRRAEQVEQQPRVAAEIADQREVRVVRQRPRAREKL